MLDEVWQNIPSAPGYAASNLGRIRGKLGRICKGTPNRRGYLRVSVHVGGQQLSRSIHQLVLEAFVGPRPEGHHGAHLNGSKQDNRVENLAWVLPVENEAHKVAHGTAAKGERHGSAKLTAAQIDDIKRRHIPYGGDPCRRRGNSDELAREFGVGRRTITDIVKGTYWPGTSSAVTMAEVLGALAETTDMLEACVAQMRAWEVTPVVDADRRVDQNRALSSSSAAIPTDAPAGRDAPTYCCASERPDGWWACGHCGTARYGLRPTCKLPAPPVSQHGGTSEACPACEFSEWGPGVVDHPQSSANGGRPWSTCVECNGSGEIQQHGDTGC